MRVRDWRWRSTRLWSARSRIPARSSSPCRRAGSFARRRRREKRGRTISNRASPRSCYPGTIRFHQNHRGIDMRVAIIGQQDFGKAALTAFLERGDDVAAVFCAPEKPGARPDPLRLAAEEKGLNVHLFPNYTSAEAQDALRALKVDIGIMAYVLIFAPQAFVTIPKHGTIQFHPSLLPLHRGPSSINWPIMLGRKTTGLTIFRPNDGLDDGALVLQKEVAIGPDDTLGSVYFDKIFPAGVAALLEAADLVLAGEASEYAQDEANATYEGWVREPESRIDWGI